MKIKIRIAFILSCFVALLPFLAFPPFWKQIGFLALGIMLLGCITLIHGELVAISRALNKRGGTVTDTFVENGVPRSR